MSWLPRKVLRKVPRKIHAEGSAEGSAEDFPRKGSKINSKGKHNTESIRDANSDPMV